MRNYRSIFFPLKTVCGIGEQQDAAWNDVGRIEKSSLLQALLAMN